MNIEELREYCLSVKGATECMPFDEDTLVFKVMGKMFTYTGLRPKNGEFWANMKCDPEKSTELMEKYNGIFFGHHSDKKYWISIYLESDLDDKLIKELIDHSVEEVIKKLPKKKEAADWQVYISDFAASSSSKVRLFNAQKRISHIPHAFSSATNEAAYPFIVSRYSCCTSL